MIDIIWVHVCTQGWRSRGSRATVKDPTRSIVVRSHVLRGEHPCKTEQVTMQRKKKTVQAPRLQATGCTQRVDWTEGEERVGSRRQKTRRTRKGCAAPDQARRAETETDDGRLRGSFWWGGRERWTGDRENRTGQAYMSPKGSLCPSMSLLDVCRQVAHFDENGSDCVLTVQWGQAVGPAAAATTVKKWWVGGSGSDHARVRRATTASQVSQSIRQ